MYRTLTFPDHGPHWPMPAPQWLSVPPSPEWEGWKARLFDAVKNAIARGKSVRKICNEAGVSPSYLSSIFQNPTQQARRDELHRIARALGVSTIWIETGRDISPDAEELVEFLDELPEPRRSDIMDWIRGRRAEWRLRSRKSDE